MSKSAHENEEVEPVQPFQIYSYNNLHKYTQQVVIEISQKKFKQGWLRTYFLEKNPGISRFVTLLLEISDQDKTKLHH